MRRRTLSQQRALFPESIPPGLNYAVVTGTLIADPIEGEKGPEGDPITLLEIKFPVAHPEDPRLLWTYAFYDVEVPGKVGVQDIKELRKGAPVLVAGQLSERPARMGEQAESPFSSSRGCVQSRPIHPDDDVQAGGR
jgi:hypothetical protein